MLSHLNISALASSTAMLATVDSLLATQLVGVIVVVTCHRGSQLPRRCSINDLTAASQKNLLGSIDHARVLIIVALVSVRLRLCHLLLLKHLLILHLLHLLKLVGLLLGHKLLVLRTSRLHRGLLRARHRRRLERRGHPVLLRL